MIDVTSLDMLQAVNAGGKVLPREIDLLIAQARDAIVLRARVAELEAQLVVSERVRMEDVDDAMKRVRAAEAENERLHHSLDCTDESHDNWRGEIARLQAEVERLESERAALIEAGDAMAEWASEYAESREAALYDTWEAANKSVAAWRRLREGADRD